MRLLWLWVVILLTVYPVSSVVAQTPAQPLAALINGKRAIPLATLTAQVNRQLEARKAIGVPPPADLKSFTEAILDALIEQAVIEEAAAIQGVTVTEAEIDKEITTHVNALGGRDKWLTFLAADKMNEADYRVGVRSALLTNKMRNIVTRGIGPTADMVRARHILLAELNGANTVLTQLRNGGDFARLAAQYSLDQSTRTNGGDLGWFPRGQLFQKSVEDSAFSLPLNQISAPIKSDLGYHLIQVTERATRPLDPAVRARLQQETFESWLRTIVKQATIVKYPR